MQCEQSPQYDIGESDRAFLRVTISFEVGFPVRGTLHYQLDLFCAVPKHHNKVVQMSSPVRGLGLSFEGLNHRPANRALGRMHN